MRCKNCGAEIAENAKFCQECGAKIESKMVCPVCGTEVSGGKFCPECGAALDKKTSESKDLIADIDQSDGLKKLSDGIVDKTRQENDKYIKRLQKLQKARSYVVREMYAEAKELYDGLLKDNPADMEIYMGYIRIATKNYTRYDGEEIDRSIRMAQRVSGKEDLSQFDRDYAAFIEHADINFTEKFMGDTGLSAFLKLNVVENNELIRYKDSDADVVIPKGITSIGKMAFNERTDVKTIKLSNTVTSIGINAFRGCTSLTSVKISSSVNHIDSTAFVGCESLVDITVDPKNEDYKSVDGVLYSRNWKGIVKYPAGKTAQSFAIPDGTTQIDDSAFSGCRSLIKVTIPNSVYSIGEYAFLNCPLLKDVNIPDGVKTIRRNAFNMCSSLVSVNIPSGVSKIGAGAYANCDSLISIHVDTANRDFKSVDGVLYSKDGKTILKYPSGKIDKNFDIPLGVTAIGEMAFAYSQSLEEVTIPGGVTSIDSWAFLDCRSLRKIIIPLSVDSIGYRVFACCENLTIYLRRSKTSKFGDTWADGAKVVWNYKGLG